MKEKMILIGSSVGNVVDRSEKFGDFSLEYAPDKPRYFGRLTVKNGKIAVDILKQATLVPNYEKESIEYLKKYVTHFTRPEDVLRGITMDKPEYDKYMGMKDEFKKDPEKWLEVLSEICDNCSEYTEREDSEFPIVESNSFLASLKK